MKAVFVRALDAEDKAATLKAVIGAPDPNRERFTVDPQTFANLPGSPFGYWVGDRILGLFAKYPALEGARLCARRGSSTGDDFWRVRVWWEVPGVHGKCWPSFAKGGAYSRFFFDVHLVAAWDDKRGTYAGFLGRPGRDTARPEAAGYYFRRGVTWPRRTQGGLSFRALPEGCIFGDKGPTAFAYDDNQIALMSLLAMANSRAFRALVDLQMAFGSYEVGVIQRTPVPELNSPDESALAALARRAWSLTRLLDTRTETSHAFVLPALLQVEGRTLVARAAEWSEHVRVAEAELATIQSEIDERCFERYGIGEDDRRAITGGVGEDTGAVDMSEAEREGEDGGEFDSAADTSTLGADLVTWAAGVAFGRFDVRLATGVRMPPIEPEPFDPLPVCSPAMLTGEDGLPLAWPPAEYPISFPDDGILVDDPGHPRDLTTAIRAVFETVFSSRADAVWQEAAALLDPRGHDLRTWLASGFFEHHLRRHSKSRRKAPILWQLGMPSGGYSVWCYAHRLTRDSLFAIQNDVVAAKLAHEERRLSSLVTQAGQTPSARDRAEIAVQEAFVNELRTLAEEVRRVAPLWNPDLDDGIVLVMAPLWRLVPTHKAWQKELKARWDDLVVGKYDWAQLAMHLWAERVVPKCATDRSLAIAHGLEDVFWVEGSDGKWTRRAIPTRPIDELVIERTSPAVKASLASLLEAPAQAGSAGRRRRNAGVIV